MNEEFRRSDQASFCLCLCPRGVPARREVRSATSGECGDCGFQLMRRPCSMHQIRMYRHTAPCTRMFVCLSVCLCVCLCVVRLVCTHAHTHPCARVCTVFTYVCTHVCMYVHTYYVRLQGLCVHACVYFCIVPRVAHVERQV